MHGVKRPLQRGRQAMHRGKHATRAVKWLMQGVKRRIHGVDRSIRAVGQSMHSANRLKHAAGRPGHAAEQRRAHAKAPLSVPLPSAPIRVIRGKKPLRRILDRAGNASSRRYRR